MYRSNVAKGKVIPAGRDHFYCPKCGKRYRFKQSLVNQPLSCGCGGKFSVSLPEDVPLAFDLDPAARPQASYETPKVFSPASDPRATRARWLAMDLFVPAVLLVIGLVGRGYLLQLAAQKHELKLPVVAVVGMMELMLSVVAVVGAVFLMSMILSIEFPDSLGKVVFKIVAIVAFAGAAGLAIASMGRGGNSWAAASVGLALIGVLNFTLITWLLRLELDEAPLIVAAATVLQCIVMFAIAQAVGPRLAGAVMFGAG